MFYEDAQDAWDLYNISPELTCNCDQFHTCQQCHEEENGEDASGLPTPNKKSQVTTPRVMVVSEKTQLNKTPSANSLIYLIN